jgi:PPK2 family polyphosphate:nucleotide phosphotransferase
MDAAGKDSTINHVMSGVNPQGCSVKSFKHPSPLELNHDYLWRSTRDLPERGMIGIFNRSYYEEVLVAKVHPEIVLNQNLPDINAVTDISPSFWDERYSQIRNYEQRLHTNGIKVVKFFLHLSKNEQAKRFLKRIKKEDKNWKFSEADMKERAYWDDYQNAYERCIQETSNKHAPWYVIPADHKWFMRAAVSQIIVDEITSLSPKYPQIDNETKSRLAKAREQLELELGLTTKSN